MLWNYLTLLKEIHWNDLLDIALATALFWFALHALRTTRTRRMGIGLLLFGIAFLTANKLELNLTVWILQGFTAVILLIVVVVYQNELRRLLESIPTTIFRRDRTIRGDPAGQVDLLAKVVGVLTANRWGALIVLPGKDRLEGIITAGVRLDGQLSKALLLSLFDPNSPGHDGALVIREGRVDRFGCRLPLSDRDDQLKDKGTRHAAALGLVEKSDALVLVVSEETGRISVACEGSLRTIAAHEQLREAIDEFLQSHCSQSEKPGRLRNRTLWAGLEGVAGLLTATVLWLVLVPGSVIETITFEIAVEVQNIPSGYALAAVTPPKVAVSLAGEKRNLFQLKADDLIIRLDGTLTSLGRQTFPINSSHLHLPPNIEIAALAPAQVRVSVEKLD